MAPTKETADVDHVGIVAPDFYLDSRQALVEFAQRVESLGYDSLWFGERWGREGFSVLSHLAAVTDDLELGTAIVNPFSRSPALLAMNAATVDELSGGRFTLGIGASTPYIVENWYGEEFEHPLAHTAEAVRIIRKVLSGEEVTHEGIFDDLSGFSYDAPVERPDLPVYLAALGPKNRKLVGEFGDGWMPHALPFPAIDSAFEAIADGAIQAGRDPEDITVAPFVPAVATPDEGRARDSLAAHFSFYLATSDYYRSACANFGFADECEAIHEAWTDGDREAARAAVTDELIDAVGLAATPEEAQADLAALADHGVDRPLVKIPDVIGEDALDSTLEALAPGD